MIRKPDAQTNRLEGQDRPTRSCKPDKRDWNASSMIGGSYMTSSFTPNSCRNRDSEAAVFNDGEIQARRLDGNIDTREMKIEFINESGR